MNIVYELYGILVAIICSVIASYLFWLFSFKATNVKLIFAYQIERSKSTQAGTNSRYRLKIINVGKRDLLELNIIAKLSIQRNKIKNNCYLRLGHQEIIPILYGKKHQNEINNKNKGFAWTLQFHLTDDFLQEFSKTIYPETIRSAAALEQLTLDDIFAEFGKKARITIYAFGYDAVTGARKMFVSSSYTINDIWIGKYNHSIY